MAVTFAELEDQAVEVLNASIPSATYGDVSSGRFKAAEITPVLRLVDISILRQILSNPNDGRRSAYLTTSTVAHGAAIPTHIAPIDAIYATVTGGLYAGTRAIEPWSVSKLNELEDENRNPQSNPLIAPHAIIEGLTVFHNAAGIVLGGASAVTVTVRYATLTYSSGASSIQSPDEFARAIVCGGLATLMQKDGQRVSSAGLFENMYRAEMKALGMGSAAPLDMSQMQEAA